MSTRGAESRPPVAELGHAAHDARQREQCERTALETAAARLEAADCARWTAGRWQPAPYPGFAFHAPAEADARNRPAVDRLAAMRDALVATAARPGRIYPLPTPSLHQTIANLFSGERLTRYVVRSGRLESFPGVLAESLGGGATHSAADTARMSLIGIALFRTAVGALGIFDDARHYARVLAARERVYGHPRLAALGLVRTRPFVAHVTLAYLAAVPSPVERCALIERLLDCNAEFARRPLPYFMPAAVLCRYRDLAAFTPQAPTVALAL